MPSLSQFVDFIPALALRVDERPAGHISGALLSLLIVAVSQNLLAQDTDGQNSTVVYPAEYFSQWAPITAKDMLDRIPGQDNSSPSGGGRILSGGGNPSSGGRGLGGGNSGATRFSSTVSKPQARTIRPAIC